MNVVLSILEYRRMVFAAVALLGLAGLIAWFEMDRQEDPFFPYRYGHVLAPWPGADPEQVERLVLNRLEEELAQIEEVRELRGTARLGFAHVIVGMHQHVYDTDSVWERIRVAVARAEAGFPDGAGPVEVQDRSMDSEGIVLAITGSDDLLELAVAARQLRRDLFRIGDIARIELVADPGEQLTLSLDDAVARSLGIDGPGLAAQLAARNRTLPGGTLLHEGRSLVLRPGAEFHDIDELASTPIRTASGALLPLSEIAGVSLEAADPPNARMWHNGRPAVGLGIVIPENRLNAVRFGERVRALIEELRPDYAPLEIHEMFYQPRWVADRLAELGRSLLIGVTVVALLLLATMGLRLGLTVALLLPLVTLGALAVYAMGGGVLHQMAVAGMVIALGMLVDNAIVMVENIQWYLDRGRTARQAAANAVRELAAPLAAATGTTLAAFTPLLLARGDTADFTRAIPVMVMLVLAVSYLYAIFATPLIAAQTLKPSAGARPSIVGIGEMLGRLAFRRPALILSVTAGLIVAAGLLSVLLPRDFFPDTDRTQLIVDLQFPEGTHLDHTTHQAGALAAQLAGLPRVEEVHHFAGSTGSRFYYNLIRIPRAPHLARLVVVAGDADDLPGLMDWVRRHVPEQIPDAQVVTKRLGQGPPVDAPVEILIFSPDPQDLADTAEAVTALLRRTPGAIDARHRLGTGLASLRFEVDDAHAARYGLSREDVALALAGASRGVEFSTWRAGREPAPMLIRSPEGERFPMHALDGVQIRTASAGTIALAEIAVAELDWQPALIEHRDLQRMTMVLSEVAVGSTYNQVLSRLRPELERLELPPRTRIELGGSAAEAGEANTALFAVLPVGILLLLAFLLAQFNSFRLVGIVLVTVPLAAIGVVPGLLITGQPFSFTAILGVVALVGIVVNNAIVLIDRIRIGEREGLTPDNAIIAAVGRRIRPILLTTATTVAGLLPLTFTRSTLWPPMAWAIISGLIAATLLTLLVIPALYRVLMVRTPA